MLHLQSPVLVLAAALGLPALGQLEQELPRLQVHVLRLQSLVLPAALGLAELVQLQRVPLA